MACVNVQLSERSYSILIESGSLRNLGLLLKNSCGAQRVLLAVDSAIAQSHGMVALQSLEAAGLHAAQHTLKADESMKSLQATADLYQAMSEMRLERASVVVALGGGIVGDLAGFAAATYLRGISIMHAPTTLLAMVDASIGGKTAVNLRNAEGALLKNMIGAFWQPRLVVIDPTVLRTLAPRDFRCGLAECIKHAMIADRSLMDFLHDHAGQIESLDAATLERLVERSARVKAAIVQSDERETGARALLNLGHTFAHAIEALASHEIKHGEAVSIGIVAAMSCAVSRGMLQADEQQRTLELLKRFQLPTRIWIQLDAANLMQAMHRDKKVQSGTIRLILPEGLGTARIVDDVDESTLLSAWREVGARMTA